MGKKLIIKGADFSENGMLETVITSDQSALYNNQNVEVTAENIGSMGSNRTMYYYITFDGHTLNTGTNYPNLCFSNQIDVEGFDKVELNFNFVFSGDVGDLGFMFAYAFVDASSNWLKVCTDNVNANLPESVLVRTSGSIINQEVDIPAGAKYLYLTDRASNATALANHKAILKKYVIE